MRLDEALRERFDRAAESPRYARKRLRRLDREWDIDRAILIPFAMMGLAGLVLARRGNRAFRFPLRAQVLFVLGYAAVGWCPPAAVLRRLGFRTRQEIESERLGMLAHLTR